MDCCLALQGTACVRSQSVCSRAVTNGCMCVQPSGAKLNGTSANGSSSNQVGQAPAPKAPGEAPPKAKRPAKTKEFNNINRCAQSLSECYFTARYWQNIPSSIAAQTWHQTFGHGSIDVSFYTQMSVIWQFGY